MRKWVLLISFLVVLSTSVNSYAKEKDPLIAGCMSCLLTGLGQVYNGEIIKGGMFFGGTLVGTALIITSLGTDAYGDPTINTGTYLTGIAIASASHICSIVDAVIVANKINEGRLGLNLTPKTMNLGMGIESKKTCGMELSLNYNFK
ncbi:MAG: hypothetical protein PHE49_05725 [bacterium]|nr:hypothetical protein [bacterium]